MGSFRRNDGRRANALRPIAVETQVLDFPAGSVLIAAGRTRVLCAASFVEGVPRFLDGSGRGWVTAEYAMLPASTPERKVREIATGRPDSRATEIKRLIGRAVRAVVDFEALGENTIWLDCDVLQADGGTRTLSVTGAWIALELAARALRKAGKIERSPLTGQIAAVSVGVVEGRCLLDLDYSEDAAADVDMNVVMSRDGRFIELQGTAEREPFDRDRLDRLLDLAAAGCRRLMTVQRRAIKEAE